MEQEKIIRIMPGSLNYIRIFITKQNWCEVIHFPMKSIVYC